MTNPSWYDGLVPWEIALIREKGLEKVVQTAEYHQIKRLIKHFIMIDETNRLIAEGKKEEAQCRAHDCIHCCQVYLGNECNQTSGNKIPVIIGLMVINNGKLVKKGASAIEKDRRFTHCAIGS